MAGHRIEEGGIDLTVNLSDGSWTPIPGYDAKYFINRKGLVCNFEGHIIKPMPSKYGPRVELRRNGQREKILVRDLLADVGYPTCGGGSNEAG